MCEYCDDRCKTLVKEDIDTDVFVYTGLLCVQSYTVDIEIEIKFCPMCGRKLEEEEDGTI